MDSGYRAQIQFADLAVKFFDNGLSFVRRCREAWGAHAHNDATIAEAAIAVWPGHYRALIVTEEV